MKKLGFVVLFFLSALLLAGCQEQKDYVTVEVKNIVGEVVFTERFEYPEDSDKPFIEIIDEAIDLDYSMSEYGAFVKGVAGIYPMETGISYNYWFGLYVNNEETQTGLDQVEYIPNMVISFIESSMLSPMDALVDYIIYSFMNKRISDYINLNKIDQYVLEALILLNEHNYVSTDFQGFTYPTLSDTTLGNMIRIGLMNKSKDIDNSTLISTLLSQDTTNVYEAISILNLMDILGVQHDNQKRLDTLNILLTTIPQYMDVDFAGMALRALKSHVQDQSVQTFKESMINFIKSQQQEAGISAYDSVNSASTAMAIMGLVSVGLNPTDEAFTVGAHNLVSALLTFNIGNGFKYTLEDQTEDANFATPQSIYALVVYKIFRDLTTSPF